MKKRETTTIDDVARHANVSTATVSRVLAKSDKVKASTRERVLESVRALAYFPNTHAQGLAGGRVKTLGFVIDELENFFFIELAGGVQSEMLDEMYSMQLTSSRWIGQRELELVQMLLSYRVQGILISPVSPRSDAIALLKDSGVPFLMVNCSTDDPDVAYVACDNRRGGRMVAEFVNQNVRDQTIVISGFEHQTLEHRIAGFEEAYTGDAPLVRYRGVSTVEDATAIVQRLRKDNGIDSVSSTVFVTNDNVAIAILDQLIRAGIRVPEDVAVIGYDDIRVARFARVPLTTVSQSAHAMGRIAAGGLMRMIREPAGGKPQHLIEPQLIVRESAPGVR